MPRHTSLTEVTWEVAEFPGGPGGQPMTMLSFNVFSKQLDDDGEPVADQPSILTEIVSIPLDAASRSRLAAALEGRKVGIARGIPDAALRREPPRR